MPRWTKADYELAIGVLRDGMNQLEPDGNNCSICGDSGHQAWECHHNPLVKMARADKADNEWRCYSCGKVFTDDKSAFEHFGMDITSPPACQCDDLTKLLRWAEIQKHDTLALRPDSNIFKPVIEAIWRSVINEIINMRLASKLRHKEAP